MLARYKVSRSILFGNFWKRTWPRRRKKKLTAGLETGVFGIEGLLLTCRAGSNTSDFGSKADNGSFSELARKRQAYSAGLSGVDMTVGNSANRCAGQARQVIVLNLVGLRIEEIEHVKLQF